MLPFRHLSRLLAFTAVLCTWGTGYAASSYFLLQGTFGPNGEYETHKFRVEYDTTLQVTGLDSAYQNTGVALLAAIFSNGTASPTGVYSNSIGTVDASGGFLTSFALGGGAPVFAGAYPSGPQWGYFAAGGSYIDTWGGTSGSYAAGIWTQTASGMDTRYLTDGSYDAWTLANMIPTGVFDEWGQIYNFGPPNPAGGNQPLLADFAGSGYIEQKVSADGLGYSVYRVTAVPEPGRALLLLVGVCGATLRRRRRVA